MSFDFFIHFVKNVKLLNKFLLFFAKPPKINSSIVIKY